MPTDAVSLPKAWPNHVRSAILQVVSLAHYAIAAARGRAANSFNARARPSARIDGHAFSPAGFPVVPSRRRDMAETRRCKRGYCCGG